MPILKPRLARIVFWPIPSSSSSFQDLRFSRGLQDDGVAISILTFEVGARGQTRTDLQSGRIFGRATKFWRAVALLGFTALVRIRGKSAQLLKHALE